MRDNKANTRRTWSWDKALDTFVMDPPDVAWKLVPVSPTIEMLENGTLPEQSKENQ